MFQHPTSADLLRLKPPFPWEQDQYFKPVIEDDPLLQLDFECEACDGGEGGDGGEAGESGDGGEGGDGGEKYKEALSQALLDLDSMRYVRHTHT